MTVRKTRRGTGTAQGLLWRPRSQDAWEGWTWGSSCKSPSKYTTRVRNRGIQASALKVVPAVCSKSPHTKQQQRSSTQKPQTRKGISKTVGSSGCLSHTSGPERVWGVGLKKKATGGQAARHARAKDLQRKPQSLVPCSLARPALFCSRRWLVSTGCHSQAHSSVGPEPLCHTVATFLIAVDFVQQV